MPAFNPNAPSGDCVCCVAHQEDPPDGELIGHLAASPEPEHTADLHFDGRVAGRGADELGSRLAAEAGEQDPLTFAVDGYQQAGRVRMLDIAHGERFAWTQISVEQGTRCLPTHHTGTAP